MKANENQNEIMKRVKNMSFKNKVDYVNINRKIYNGMCKPCKWKVGSKILRTRNVFKFESLCPTCQVMARGFEEKINEALQ